MVLTTGPRWGTVLTRPSASSARSASRMDGRLTPIISQSSRSTRRWPGFSVPDMIASRSFCATIERTVGTSSIRSVECSSPRFSMVYRPDTGIGSIAIYGQNHHLRNLNMRRLVQCKNDRTGNIGRIERHLELVEIVLFLLPVAAIAGEDDVGSGQAGLHFGDPDRGFREFSPERLGKHVHPRLAGAVGSHIRDDADGVDRADV